MFAKRAACFHLHSVSTCTHLRPDKYKYMPVAPAARPLPAEARSMPIPLLMFPGLEWERERGTKKTKKNGGSAPKHQRGRGCPQRKALLSSYPRSRTPPGSHPPSLPGFAQNEKRLHQQRRLFVYLVLLPLRPWLGYFESCGVLAGACRSSKKQPLDHRNGCCREHRTAQQPCPPL